MALKNGEYGEIIVRMLERHAASGTDMCVRETFNRPDGGQVEVECWGADDWVVNIYRGSEVAPGVVFEEIGDEDVITALQEGGV